MFWEYNHWTGRMTLLDIIFLKLNNNLLYLGMDPRKKSGIFFSKFRQLFRFFSGKFLKYRPISMFFPETSRKKPCRYKGSTRCFSREKKRKSVNPVKILPWRISRKYMKLNFRKVFLEKKPNYLWKSSKKFFHEFNL